jgi:hypothetical protein
MDGWLTLAEAAALLGYHRTAIGRALAAAGVATVERGGIRWVKRADVASLTKRTVGRPRVAPTDRGTTVSRATTGNKAH